MRREGRPGREEDRLRVEVLKLESNMVYVECYGFVPTIAGGLHPSFGQAVGDSTGIGSDRRCK